MLGLKAGGGQVTAEYGAKLEPVTVKVISKVAVDSSRSSSFGCTPTARASIVAQNLSDPTVDKGAYIPVPRADTLHPLEVRIKVCSPLDTYRAVFTYHAALAPGGVNNSSGLEVRLRNQRLLFFAGTNDRAPDFTFRDTILVSELPPGSYVFRALNYGADATLKATRVFDQFRSLTVAHVRNP